MFSGRPNPQWDTSAEETAQISALIDGLPDAALEPVTDDGLGYRGFVITWPDGQSATVAGAAVLVTPVDRTRCGKADPDRTMESALVHMARKYLAADLYEFLLSQVGAG
jgi:hypothetical protein